MANLTVGDLRDLPDNTQILVIYPGDPFPYHLHADVSNVHASGIIVSVDLAAQAMLEG
jgi:hypothetical protein